MVEDSLQALLAEISGCRLCAAHLPLGPRPVLRASATARVMLVGQAPGTKVHKSGIPFNDPSGDTLRDWLGIDSATFYDENRIAIMPMGFCYPGRDVRGGDSPPRPECAPHWHAQVRALLPNIELTVLIGAYAQAYYLGPRRGASVSETVARWREYLPDFLPTPHPSPRNRNWLRQRPWFLDEVVPELRQRVQALL
ncbi:MAG: uracil-DNA glycosylase family protein [Alphaproteobacteria bacterium]|nr:uracil-DNA glycosylase family protein [Alphaproteobacteria bacterium]MBU0797793.1 uracil-DNA glycosylase family protein [Alphaproteobacteria bacterium]MBU0888850.1 uracil-DNA glycosylase family protein [Alphaproteobacteria bacterium]MBU1813870.1 uracil-DNA glycosylase family protein [Alphaproteobacteria bacterium]